MSLADEIDALYQSPLAQFTAERNALLKRAEAGADKSKVRGLQKPSVPAWAVNQLYWQRRPVFDRLIDAAGRLRAAHLQQLSGKRAEVAVAERAHHDAIKAAVDEIRTLLRSAGETASASTMAAVTETLQALPTGDEPGRLTRPLKPAGFEALAGLVSRGGTVSAFPAPARAEPTKPAPSRPAALSDAAVRKQDAAAAKREADTRRRAIADHEKTLREAAEADREARTALARAEMSLARARRERKALEARLDELTIERDRLVTDVDQRRKQAERAGLDRQQAEARLESLRTGRR